MENDKFGLEPLIAAVFNEVHGAPYAEPLHTYLEVECECGDGEELEQWRAIQNALARLPSHVAEGLDRLLTKAEEWNNAGYRWGLIKAARIAKQRDQTELAKDLLIQACVTSKKALEHSGAEPCDIYECAKLFEDWAPTQRDLSAAFSRNAPPSYPITVGPETSAQLTMV
jgi:hypothetical protein